MKAKEELLKIYSAYLPYKLKGKSIYNVSDDSQNETCTLTTKDGFNNLVGIDDWVNQYLYPIKPILYSMEMLTQEIEHNRKRFVPIEVFEIGDDSDSYPNEYDHGNIKLIKELESIAKNKSYHDIQFLPFEVVQRLISWHFNVFGLEESEYIKKETL